MFRTSVLDLAYKGKAQSKILHQVHYTALLNNNNSTWRV